MKETKFKKSIEKFDPEISLNTDEALKLITSQPRRKFLESVDVAVRLGIDPKNPTKMLEDQSHCQTH